MVWSSRTRLSTAALLGVSAPSARPSQEIAMPSDLLSRPLVEIARDLREKRASARELTEAAIARRKRFRERLHAYSLWTPEQARAVADAADAVFTAGVPVGPLRGVPVSLKDLFAAAGYPCFVGPPAAGQSVG